MGSPPREEAYGEILLPDSDIQDKKIQDMFI